MTEIDKAAIAPLYICRPVLNAGEIVDWAKSQGFSSTLDGGDMHVTVCFSRAPVAWAAVHPEQHSISVRRGARSVEPLGDKGAVVLKIQSPELDARWRQLRALGASWDWPAYQPHVTLTYDGAPDMLPAPFPGDILLGPEMMQPLDDDWRSAITEKADIRITAHIIKSDDDQRMVYGWASVATEGGDAVVDSQGDMVSMAELEKAATEFMESVRVAKAMHEGSPVGEVLHSLPLSAALAQSLGIQAKQEGWIVGMKIHDDAAWQAVKDGRFKMFSFGGFAERVQAD